MKVRIRMMLAAAVGMTVACMSAGCSDEGGDDNRNPRRDIPVTRSEAEIAESANSFASRLMGRLAETGVKDLDGTVSENYVISPLSLSMALSMTANGADGNTRDEILEVLGFEAEEMSAANTLNQKLLEKLPTLDAKTTVSLANALWVDSKYEDKIRPEFSGLQSEVYQAPSMGVKGLGFAEGMKRINEWGSEHTNGVIPELLSEPLGENTLMALTNALYFKGEWTRKFDKAKTARADFHNLDGTRSEVMMMRKDELAAQAFEDEGYKAAAFSFGNRAYSLIVVVPEYGVHPAKAFASIDPGDLSSLATDAAFGTHLNVKLPRFTVENGANMKPVLAAMGIREAFVPIADFTAMWTKQPDEFCIGKVYQRAKIIVDEEGAEAAAVTIVTGEVTSPGPVESKDFVVDRPFAFAIAERSTGVLLFTGIVTKL